MNLNHKILTPLSLLLSLMGAGACSDNSPALPDTPGQQGVATLGISLGLSGPSRSAGADGSFEEGVDYENYLDIIHDDYRIYFFSNDNKYVSTFDPYVKPALMPDPDVVNGVNTYYYSFLGDVPVDLPTEFKMVVLANWGAANYPEEAPDTDGDDTSAGSGTEGDATTPAGPLTLKKGETTIADLTTAALSQFAALSSPEEGQQWLGDNRLIPFYGVRAYNLNEISKDYVEDGKIKGDIFVDLNKSEYALPLIRAMARVEVILDNPLASFSSVKMTRSNATGYSAPYSGKKDWKFDFTDYFHGYDWTTDFTRELHLVGDANDATPREVQLKKESADGEYPERWVAYVAEYQNIGTEAFTTIEVTLADPDGNADGSWSDPSNTIYFATDGKKTSNDNDAQATAQTSGRFNIERNNIYRFTVKDMTTTIKCDVDIQPYAEVKLEYDLGLQRDERGDLMVVPDSKGNLPDFFNRFMLENQPGWPKDEVTGERLNPQEGDYYAIVLGSDGNIKNASVWLKDASGCRVLTNFALPDPDDGHCSTRKVTHFFNTTETTYYKDIDGDMRLYHYPNHSSVIINVNGETCYKYYTNFGNENAEKKYYQVESWTIEKDDDGNVTYTECWFVVNSVSKTEPVTEGEGDEAKTYLITTTETTFRLVDAASGKPTTGDGEDCLKKVTEVTKKSVDESEEAETL